MATAEIAIRRARTADTPRLAELLTELGGRVVGCVSLHAIPFLERTGRWLRIESLVVDAGQRRSGTGRALLAAAEGFAREWGCLLIEVTSLRSRADAHAFYRSQGFIDSCEQSGRFVKELT